jgi:hypothetical protein
MVDKILHRKLRLNNMTTRSELGCSRRMSSSCHQVRVITVFTVFQLLIDFVCLYTYEFLLSLCKIVRSSVILLVPLFTLEIQY